MLLPTNKKKRRNSESFRRGNKSKKRTVYQFSVGICKIGELL